MPQFRTVWEMDVQADTPEEAARLAHGYQTKPGTTATCFTVYDEEGDATDVDLTELDEEQDDEESDYDPVREHGTYHVCNGSVVG